MTESAKPAVRPPDPVLDRAARVGTWLAASEVKDPNAQQKAMAAALRLFYAEQLNLPPLAAAELSVISGRLVVGAKLLRALAFQAGFRVIKAEETPESCTAAVIELDTGEEIGRTTYTLEQARAAGLIRDRSAWKTHPHRMLWARAAKFAIDDYAPHVALGLMTEDEAAEVLEQPAPPPPPENSTEPVDEADWKPADDVPATEPLPEQPIGPPVHGDATAEQLKRIDELLDALSTLEPDTDWHRVAFEPGVALSAGAAEELIVNLEGELSTRQQD